MRTLGESGMAMLLSSTTSSRAASKCDCRACRDGCRANIADVNKSVGCKVAMEVGEIDEPSLLVAQFVSPAPSIC